VLDVGGGSSALASALVDEGHDVRVIDIARPALALAQQRMGVRASDVRWMEADITRTTDLEEVDVWHDRAVFHFLIDPDDQRHYVDLATRTVVPGGHAIVATFGPEGPTRCSGLPVRRYGAHDLQARFGAAFELVDSTSVIHVTPKDVQQQFVYALLRRRQPG
jgi:SAM-dependent methyltransferase